MNLRSNKGFTGVDITVAIIIISIFAGVIAILFYNYNITSQEIERKSKATEYAVAVIEKIKNTSFESSNVYVSDEKNLKEYNNYLSLDAFKINELNDAEDGYNVKVTITDYSNLKTGATSNILKKVDVVVGYKVGNQDESVPITTYISPET